MIRVGDQIQFKVFQLYKGEVMPDIPEEEWTGIVILSWGSVRNYHKVRRDYDDRIIPVMERDIIPSDRKRADNHKPKKETQKRDKAMDSGDVIDPQIQTITF